MEWIIENNISVLKAHKASFSDHGKDKIVVLQIVNEG